MLHSSKNCRGKPKPQGKATVDNSNQAHNASSEMNDAPVVKEVAENKEDITDCEEAHEYEEDPFENVKIGNSFEDYERDMAECMKRNAEKTEIKILKNASSHIVSDPRSLEIDFSEADLMNFDPYLQKAMRGSVDEAESWSRSLLANGIYSDGGRAFKLHSRIPDSAMDIPMSAAKLNSEMVESVRKLAVNAMLPTPNPLPERFMANSDDQPQFKKSMPNELRAAMFGNLTFEDILMDAEVNIPGIEDFKTEGLEEIFRKKVELSKKTNRPLSELWKYGLEAEEWDDPCSNMKHDCEPVVKAGIDPSVKLFDFIENSEVVKMNFDKETIAKLELEKQKMDNGEGPSSGGFPKIPGEYFVLKRSENYKNLVPPDVEDNHDIKMEQDDNLEESTSSGSNSGTGCINSATKPRSLLEMVKDIQNLGKADNSHWKGARYDPIVRRDIVVEEKPIDDIEDDDENRLTPREQVMLHMKEKTKQKFLRATQDSDSDNLLNRQNDDDNENNEQENPAEEAETENYKQFVANYLSSPSPTPQNGNIRVVGEKTYIGMVLNGPNVTTSAVALNAALDVCIRNNIKLHQMTPSCANFIFLNKENDEMQSESLSR